MFGLRDEIRGDETRIAARSDNENFRGAGRQIYGAIGADDLFCGSDVTIAGSEYFIHARHRMRAIGQRRDGLRAADARDFRQPK